MKRFLAIPLTFIYLLAMSGVMISTHYCGAKLVSWNVYLKAALCGGCDNDGCSKERRKPMKCCKDKVVVAKVKQDQNSSQQVKVKVLPSLFTPLIAPSFYEVAECLPTVSRTATIHYANAPPGNWQYIPLYKLHSRFTYYG